MKILQWDSLLTYESRESISSLCAGKEGTALTIGGFDGPHLGHESLFTAVLDASTRLNLATGIVTFSRSPGITKQPGKYPGDVSTLSLRLTKFEQKGFEFVLLIDFSGDFGKMSGGVFFDILVNTVRMRYVAVGPDFRCGHRLDTGTAEIAAISRKDGFQFDSIQQVDLDGQRISSSSVRTAIQSADFALAERLLGHPFLLDFTAPAWQLSENTLSVPYRSFIQILPRRGEYRVVLNTISGNQVDAILCITGEKVIVLPIEGSSLPSQGQISTIQFRLS